MSAALDLEPARAVDLGLADAAREGRELRRLSSGVLFSHLPQDRPASESPRRVCVATLGAHTGLDRLGALVAACRAAGRPSAVVVADEDGYARLGGAATYRWEPAPLLPAPPSRVARHAVSAGAAAARELDPHLLVVDTGEDWADLAVLVGHLRRSERWDATVVVALTDPDRDLALAACWLGVGD